MKSDDVSHIPKDPDGRSCPRLSLQPPLRLELVRVLAPEGLVPITRGNGNEDDGATGDRHFVDNLSGSRRDRISERDHVIVNGLLQNVERDRMIPQNFLFPRTTRQFTSGVWEWVRQTLIYAFK